MENIITYDTDGRVESIVQRGEGEDYYGRTGYPLADGSYEWNYAGLMTADSSRGITNIEYNHNGQPTRINYGSNLFEINTYDAAGNLLCTTSHIGAPRTRYYSAGRVFDGDSLLYSYFPGGYFDAEGGVHYMHRDYQGSVILVTDSAGTVEQHTTYYPYGEPFSEPSGQPYLFSGKERLSNSKYTDFGPRHLSTASLLWSAPDKLAGNYRQISPYTYCAANPILFRDPTGKVIEIAGTMKREDFLSVFQNLRKLTDDELVFEVKDDNSVTVKILNQKDGNKTTGTQLIRDLISSDKTTTIDYENSRGVGKGKPDEMWAQKMNSEDASNGVGSDALVNFNRNCRPMVEVQYTDGINTIFEPEPLSISLAHELIHSCHYGTGQAISNNETAIEPHSGQTSPREELETVGILGNNKTTENTIRQEHGMRERVSYRY